MPYQLHHDIVDLSQLLLSIHSSPDVESYNSSNAIVSVDSEGLEGLLDVFTIAELLTMDIITTVIEITMETETKNFFSLYHGTKAYLCIMLTTFKKK